MDTNDKFSVALTTHFHRTWGTTLARQLHETAGPIEVVENFSIEGDKIDS